MEGTRSQNDRSSIDVVFCCVKISTSVPCRPRCGDHGSNIRWVLLCHMVSDAMHNLKGDSFVAGLNDTINVGGALGKYIVEHIFPEQWRGDTANKLPVVPQCTMIVVMMGGISREPHVGNGCCAVLLSL